MQVENGFKPDKVNVESFYERSDSMYLCNIYFISRSTIVRPSVFWSGMFIKRISFSLYNIFFRSSILAF